MTEDHDDALRVLERASRILDAFDGEDEGLGIADIARRSGLPKSTVSRLVATLVRQSYLERDGRSLHLGLRVFELGQLARAPHELRAIARPVIHRLRDETGFDVDLSLRDGDDAVCVAALHGRAGTGDHIAVGSRVALRTAETVESDAAGTGFRACAPFSAPAGRIAGTIGMTGAVAPSSRHTALLRTAAADLTRAAAARGWELS